MSAEGGRPPHGTNVLELSGHDLSLEDVRRVADQRDVTVRLANEARIAVANCRVFIEGVVAAGDPVYGVTTGFGRLAEVVIEAEEQRELQRNLVRSHASGVGRPLEEREVRATMLLRANSLAGGHSGCRTVVIERLLEFLNLGIHPVVPEFGSVGASGDLGPLAHVALALMGEGEVIADGRRQPTAVVLSQQGVTPLTLEAKEGLALINGTQATTALGVLALLAMEDAVEAADTAGAMTLEGLRGTPEAFRPEVHRVRGHPGQAETGRRLAELLDGSEIRESHREGDPRVQDAYSLRCIPQIHGAARDALSYVRRVLEIETNSVTDNPLIFPEKGLVVSAGNFHGQILAQALDLLCIAVADLASVSERRVERLLNPDLSTLPAFLAGRPGIESGFMIVQVTAVDLLAELRVLAHPASVDSAPTSANQEDHVSMSFTAARKARRAVECLQYVLAIELLCAARALEFRRPLRSGAGVEEAYRRIREEVPASEKDRPLSHEMDVLKRMIDEGAFTPRGLGRGSSGGERGPKGDA